jgi:hypothetical protein
MHPYQKFDEFTVAYIECALWSSTDDNDDNLDDNYSITDISPETLAKMVSDCEVFQRENLEHIEKGFGGHDTANNEDFSCYGRAGHDFWLTRNGHGAGFWDGDWPESVATILTDSSKRFGVVDLYVGDDGQIYI